MKERRLLQVRGELFGGWSESFFLGREAFGCRGADEIFGELYRESMA